MTQERITISVIVPALNEAKNLAILIPRLWTALHSITNSAEIIVVDGGSKDDTQTVTTSLGANFVLQRRVGYGGALREGLMVARGEFIITLDSDLSHPPELLCELWKARLDADVVVASRFAPGGKSDAPVFRHVLSIVLNTIFSRVLSVPIKDSSSGYRLYRREVVRPEEYSRENFNILQEILIRAYSDGYRVKELPLHYEERVHGDSHVSLIKFAMSYIPTLYRLWKIRNNPEAADYEYLAYSSKHLLQRYWIRSRTEIIREFIGPEPRKLLDIGCGSSFFSACAPGAVALDLDPRKLRYLHVHNPNTVRAEGETLPFRSESFDQVVISQTLSYVSDPQRLVLEANRVLKSGGTLVVAVPDSGGLGWRILGTLYRALPNVRQQKVLSYFYRAALVDMLANSGFRIQRNRYICQAELILKCQKVACPSPIPLAPTSRPQSAEKLEKQR